MAIMSWSARMIGRQLKVKTAIGKAAYIHGSKFSNTQTLVSYDYSKKTTEVIHSIVLAPQYAKPWVYDAEKLWNEVEKKELRKDAQLAREIIIAFPIELNLEMRKKLIEQYVQENFVAQGMIADINMHEKPGNPHAHVLLTTRTLTPDGSFGNKERDWNKKEKLVTWRKNWADLCNAYLTGITLQRISAESHRSRGINSIPRLHVGNGKSRKLMLKLNQKIKILNSLTTKKASGFFQASSNNNQASETAKNITDMIKEMTDLISESGLAENKSMRNLSEKLSQLDQKYHPSKQTKMASEKSSPTDPTPSFKQ
jgi:ATP-dependent exoDNAse (exonuclease V) alpha subunit